MSDEKNPTEQQDDIERPDDEATATAVEDRVSDESEPKEVEFSEVPPDSRTRTDAAEGANLDRVYDLTVPVTVEVGRARLSVQEILQLAPGSVVELDHPADAPVELLVHGKCVAKGEIVVVDDFYGVRITQVGD